MGMTTLILTDNAYAHETARELQETFGEIEIFQSPPGRLPGVPTLSIRSNVDAIVERYDLAISVHCRQLFPAELISRVRCLNVHPGYNPFNRGWYPSVFSLINGLPAGVTIHEMDNEIDHGPIVMQHQIPLEPWDTSGTAYKKVMQAERVMLRANYPLLRDGQYNSAPAAEGNYNSRDDYENLKRLDLSEVSTFGDFLNRLRALTHDDLKNAFFVDESGRRIFVRVSLEPDHETTATLESD
jgi:methionyl-tRNA formyltransferase